MNIWVIQIVQRQEKIWEKARSKDICRTMDYGWFNLMAIFASNVFSKWVDIWNEIRNGKKCSENLVRIYKVGIKCGFISPRWACNILFCWFRAKSNNLSSHGRQRGSTPKSSPHHPIHIRSSKALVVSKLLFSYNVMYRQQKLTVCITLKNGNMKV